MEWYAVLDSEGKVCEGDQFKTDRQTTLEFAKGCRVARVIPNSGAFATAEEVIDESAPFEVPPGGRRFIKHEGSALSQGKESGRRSVRRGIVWIAQLVRNHIRTNRRNVPIALPPPPAIRVRNP
jgi:hypothetical protein